MAIELHHQRLNDLILKRPNSQRIARLLREMQLRGVDDVVGNLRAVHGVAIAGITAALAIGVAMLPSGEDGNTEPAKSPLHLAAQPQDYNAKGGAAVEVSSGPPASAY